MAPERPRSAGYDMVLEPRIIERRPDEEVRVSSIPKRRNRSKELTFSFKFRDLFKPFRTKKVQPDSIKRRPELDFVEPAYVELREPRRPRTPPVSPRRPPPEEFVPLPRLVPSPRHQAEEEIPILEVRSPRHPPVIHSPPSPLREHRRRRTPSPASPIREVETIRIRRLDKSDRDKAGRQRARDVEAEARIERERERSRDGGDDRRRLAEIALHERSERRKAERAAAILQQENDDRERRLAEREAAVLERERERERERFYDTPEHRRDVFQPAEDYPLRRSEAPRPPTDRGAEVIQAAQASRRLRRGEQIAYCVGGRRTDPGRHD